MKILIGPSSFAECDHAPMARLEQSGCHIIKNPYGRKLTKEETRQLLGDDVIGLIAGLETLDADVLRRSRLKAIARCGSGMANVDLEAARALGILVTATPTGPVTAVAELTLGALLSLLRKIPQADRSMHGRNWEKRMGTDLEGKQVAVIGFGRIGRKVGRLLQAFGSRVMAVDPEFRCDLSGIEGASLEDALSRADIVTLHCSGDATVLGPREFGMMKRGTFLLNAARGGLVDERSLVQALDAGTVAAAWIDTFSEEPYRGPLCDYPQVILTPHIGSYTVECRRAMEMEAAENLLRSLGEVM